MRGVCERTHVIRPREQLESRSMERLLLLWDDLDDVTAAFRHIARSAIDEAIAAAPPIATLAAALIAFFVGGASRT